LPQRPSDNSARLNNQTRVLEVEGAVLHLRLRTEEARSLKFSLNLFMEHIILATDTIRQFGPPK
jgi:hypothetical protein